MTGYKVIYFDHTVDFPELEDLICFLQDDNPVLANKDYLISIPSDAFLPLSECFYSNADEHDN